MFKGAMPAEVSDKWQAKELIKQYLFRKGVDEKKTVILIIDEGQKIPLFCLEILREFLNYETNEYKLLQIVIFAQREFEKTLKEHANLADRINLYLELGPMNFGDTRLMIQYRLNQASHGAKAPAYFSYAALWAIFRSSGGYPRKIINLCHRSLLTMIIQNRNKAGWLLARSCINRAYQKRHTKAPRITAAVALTGLFIIASTAVLTPERLHVPMLWQAQEFQTPPAPQRAARSFIPADIIRVASLPAPVHKNETDGSFSVARPQKDNLIHNVIVLQSSQQNYKDEPKDSFSSPSETDSSMNYSIPATNLETIRGGIHENFFRIVLQFTEKIVFEKPVIRADEAMIRLKDVSTKLVSFRKYKTFKSWVKLEKNGRGLNVRIGLPEDSLKLNCFEIDNPYRLVINIFINQQFEQTIS